MADFCASVLLPLWACKARLENEKSAPLVYFSVSPWETPVRRGGAANALEALILFQVVFLSTVQYSKAEGRTDLLLEMGMVLDSDDIGRICSVRRKPSGNFEHHARGYRAVDKRQAPT